jgi:hypothetical protein
LNVAGGALAKRDPQKTKRNKLIQTMKAELRELLPTVLEKTGLRDEKEVNAIIGHKTDYVIDLKHAVILAPDQYEALWMAGFNKQLEEEGEAFGFGEFFAIAKKSKAFRQYLHIFLRRSYLKHYDEYHKARPEVEEAEIWMGQNNADYGLLVTPRFKDGRWENDKSHIRRFKPRYWTIAHVLETGLVVPDSADPMRFANVGEYLRFFEHVLVRHSASSYQRKIAAMYSQLVRDSDDPLNIPLLIPELRYKGREAKHEHRLDFCIIDPDTFDKVGFELSPWSSHGRLTKTKEKTTKAVNEEAKGNFEKEMRKLKKYFQKHGIYALVYTDSDLADITSVFVDIAKYLQTSGPAAQYSFAEIDDFFK